MNKSQIKHQVFEIMLKTAVAEKFYGELKTIPEDWDLPEDCRLSPHAEKKIERMIRSAGRRSLFLKVQKAAKRAAVAAAVIIPVSLGSLLSVQASRKAIFNALLDWKSDHVSIHYQDRGASPGAKSSSSGDSAVKPGYLPEGFAEARAARIGSKYETEYRNGRGEKILLDQSPLSEEGTIEIDTEHTTRKEIEIHGEKAFLFVADTPGEKSYLVWKSRTGSFLLSSEISSDQLVKIAESMEQ